MAGKFGLIVCALMMLGSSTALAADCKDKDKEQARSHYQEGDKAYRLGDFQRAVKEFRASYELCPIPLLLYNLGQANRFAGDSKQALFFYRQYLSVGDKEQREAAQKRVAELEKQTAKGGKSSSDLDEARAHYKRGFSAYGLQRYAEAASEYEAAFQLAPDSALLYNAAQAHRMAGDFSRAIELYQSYLRLFGDTVSNRQEAEKLIATLQEQQKSRPAAHKPPEPTGPRQSVAGIPYIPPVSQPAPPPKPPFFTTLRKAGVGLAAGGVVVAVIGIGLAASVSGIANDADNASSLAEGRKLHDRAVAFNNAGWGLVGVGAAAAVAGAVMIALPHRSEKLKAMISPTGVGVRGVW